ncbi:activating signal cointegrator 1-like isoform X2 [Littorina saxatilis]|uniref:ASCH domain-containing protein n=1 Tax=Littorina saxatilis TaxID=31220 RepID=A0AAN9GQ30_9CAEN
MASSTQEWLCEEMKKLGIEINEEGAGYILSMEDAEDLQEYMFSLLGTSDSAVQDFIPRLLERWHTISGKPPPNAKVYRKSDETQVYVQPKGKKKREKNKLKDSNGSNEENAAATFASSSTSVTTNSNGVPEPSAFASILNGVASEPEQNSVTKSPSKGGEQLGIGAKKKNKFVPLYSQQGKEKLVIKLPGRTQCECQALKHKVINNCTNCGRVVCEQEGAGPCLYCGRLVCSPEDQDTLSRGSKKSEKLRQFLMRDADKFTPLCHGGGERELMPSLSAKMQEGLQKAQKHKDRLIEFDKTSVRRTQVIDDECDYFSTDSNQWLSKKDREALRKREEELRSSRHASRRDRKVTLDFAGRQVVEEANTVGQTMYDHRDAVVQQVQYGGSGDQSRGGNPADLGQGSLVNPSIVQPAPTFVPDRKSKTTSTKMSTKPWPNQDVTKTTARAHVPVIQDRELNEMSDEGMCLSMHQPWASQLVAGIKVHEGRSWYTAHRGRLWIAATAKAPSTQEIEEMENHYRQLYQDPYIEFPQHYPVGCLLGCVDLVDCLSQEEYRQKFPDGESASPYVFICGDPQELVIKFPIKGKHKIYKLDSTTHQAAKKGLR